MSCFNAITFAVVVVSALFAFGSGIISSAAAIGKVLFAGSSLVLIFLGLLVMDDRRFIRQTRRMHHGVHNK